MLRLTRAKGPDPWFVDVGPETEVARVAVTAGAAGPVGGDELALDVEVGPGSALVLSEISPTLLLPGPHSERSRTSVHIHVASGGTLTWLPEPMIAARGCDHVNDVVVHLEEGARLFMREEILLGRHGEAPGRVTQRVSVRLDGRPLYRQDLRAGTEEAGTPAVLGGHRAIGSVVIVDPVWSQGPPGYQRLYGDAAVLPLEGPAALISAVGADNLQIREQLAAGIAGLAATTATGGGRKQQQ